MYMRKYLKQQIIAKKIEYAYESNNDRSQWKSIVRFY